jgi:nicotinamidase-related amidase
VSDLSSSYVSSGFNQRLGFRERPALVVIDFVNAYLTPGSPLYAGVEDAVPAAGALLDAARAAQIPIVFTKVVFDPADTGDRGPFYRKAGALSLFIGETEAGEVVERLTPMAGERVLTKQGASAFFGTGLEQLLRSLGVDSVLISGLSTSGCVRATAVDAVQLGFVPLVVRQAVGDRAPGPHEASLFDLDAKYADVVDLDDALEHLTNLR